MAIVYDTFQQEAPSRLPLLFATAADRTVAWRDGAAVSAAQFLGHVRQVAAQLPATAATVNLCEDRYAFLVAFCAIVLRGQTNLLPSSRAPQAVDEVMAAHPGCHVLGDLPLDVAPPRYQRMSPLEAMVESSDFVLPLIDADQVVAIGYTSGSTGAPSANRKTWRSFHASTAGNLQMLRAELGQRFEVVATVPPQHMYGIEMSVLLPLLGDIGIHAGRPFFPADVAAALAEVPAPRVLVTTPVHLRALVDSGIALPPLAAMVSATAPLSGELALAAEQRFGARLLEVFGSTTLPAALVAITLKLHPADVESPVKLAVTAVSAPAGTVAGIAAMVVVTPCEEYWKNTFAGRPKVRTLPRTSMFPVVLPSGAEPNAESVTATG